LKLAHGLHQEIKEKISVHSEQYHGFLPGHKTGKPFQDGMGLGIQLMNA